MKELLPWAKWCTKGSAQSPLRLHCETEMDMNRSDRLDHNVQDRAAAASLCTIVGPMAQGDMHVHFRQLHLLFSWLIFNFSSNFQAKLVQRKAPTKSFVRRFSSNPNQKVKHSVQVQAAGTGDERVPRALYGARMQPRHLAARATQTRVMHRAQTCNSSNMHM